MAGPGFRKGFTGIEIALGGLIFTIVMALMIVVPVLTLKLNIQHFLDIEYKYANSEMMMLEMLSYEDIRNDIGLYASGLSDNGAAAGGGFSKGTLAAKVAGVLDKLSPDGGCWALYYDAPPYSSSESSWTMITMRDREGFSADGPECNATDMSSVSRAFVPGPQSGPQVMLVLRTSDATGSVPDDGGDTETTTTTTIPIGSSHTVLHFAQPMFGGDSWEQRSTVNVRNSINQYKTLTGKSLYGYTNWIADWPGDFNWIFGSGDHGLLPLFQDETLKALMVFWMPRLNGNINDQQTLKNIAAGTEDTYIRTVANECKAFGYPIYMRFGGEMNINQGMPGEGTWASNPADFVAAWKHIVDIFRAQGVTNVIWVWNPNYDESGPHHFTEYYPGDDYVDWIGIDMYQFSDSVDPDAEMAVIYNVYGNRKPVSICEWGVNAQPWPPYTVTPDAVQASYMEKFFKAVEARPNVKIISYFYVWDAFKFNAANTPMTTDVYRTRIANAMYIGADDATTT
jgi:hypothetical protein